MSRGIVSSPYYARAKCYLKLGQPDKALADLHQWDLIGGSGERSYELRGDILSMKGDNAKALDAYKSQVKATPHDQHALLAGGQLAEKLGDKEFALNCYGALISLNPKVSDLYFSRAGAEEKFHMYQQAEVDYSDAIKYQPDDALAYHGRARVRVQQKKNSLAIEDYTKAIQLMPEENGFLLKERAGVYEQSGNHALAEKDRAAATAANAQKTSPRTTKNGARAK
jgi:tetratricopeptide (TPR) repeat protein